jgi:hypothetical protein
VEIVGVETRDASTLYSVLNAIVTIPLLYMIKLDGLGFGKFGTQGLLWTDAAANLLMFAVVVPVFCGLRFGLAPRGRFSPLQRIYILKGTGSGWITSNTSIT